VKPEVPRPGLAGAILLASEVAAAIVAVGYWLRPAMPERPSYMRAKLQIYPTGWFGLQIGLSDHDIAQLIAKLNSLRSSKGHFHARSDFSGTPGIGDIEFYWAEGQSGPRLVIE
jgi:hypothetical protein